MCTYYGDGEVAAVWNPDFRVARKEHRCAACGGLIPKGEGYCSLSTLTDGNWDVAKACWLCWLAGQEFGEAHRFIPHPTALLEDIENCASEHEAGWEHWRAMADFIRGDEATP